MNNGFSYQSYVNDKQFLDEYNAYQAKYANQMRESDKVIIGLISEITKRYDSEKGQLSLLDIGCSTGNLLLHLKRLLPKLSLTGGDLAESSLKECRTNPELNGIVFETLDMLSLTAGANYDIITVNAVLYMMEDPQFEIALRSISGALKPGGSMIVFDFFHSFPQDLHINEISKSHPTGLRLRFRPTYLVEPMLVKAGFKNFEFRPFTLPIDLHSTDDSGDLITYTVQAQDTRKLPFRGTLFQPWSHLTAVRVDEHNA